MEEERSLISASDGSGGVYFILEDEFESSIVVVFKRADAKPMNNPKCLPTSNNGEGLNIQSEEGALREVVAFLLDHKVDDETGEKLTSFVGVFLIALVKCRHESFGQLKTIKTTSSLPKIWSLQIYVHT
ncbi:hypothetical protein GOP47_0030840 [Adiantum capillus-veneris]|nr:hypothetical protein GOP47_0030840 [Adiantum capillus-veneris]